MLFDEPCSIIIPALQLLILFEEFMVFCVELYTYIPVGVLYMVLFESVLFKLFVIWIPYFVEDIVLIKMLFCVPLLRYIPYWAFVRLFCVMVLLFAVSIRML